MLPSGLFPPPPLEAPPRMLPRTSPRPPPPDCACGWAGVSPWFVKRGFSLMSVGRGTTVLITNPAQLHTALAQRFIIEPAYQGLVWMAAVSAFFQLDYCTADWLFSPCEYKLDRSPEAEDVAVRIEAVIAGYRPQLTT